MPRPRTNPSPRQRRQKARSRPKATRRNRVGFDLGQLNPPQLEAVLHEAGPLLVLAGAGSGKTRVIVFRMARLIRDGVAPDTILGVTFTNKAAREMRERLGDLVGAVASEVHLSTFHSLGLRILREEIALVNELRSGFCIYDGNDQVSLVREMMRQVRVADRRLDPMRVLEIILKAKRDRLAEVDVSPGDDYTLAAHELYPRYRAQMRGFNAVDFDDLILLPEVLLQKPAVRKRWRDKFRHVLVDEYQDTSPDQLGLLKAIAAGHGNVCVVGDDDQSIYGWRGAAAGNILSFGRTFKKAREIVLDQNYRSTGNILAAANRVIANNPVRKPKNLWSAGASGEPVTVATCCDGEDEAAFVAETIQQLLYNDVRPDAVAVLYRANAQSRVFEETLALEHIPFRVVGGQSFFDRKEVRDAMAYLSVVQNPRDEISLRRIINSPPRGIGLTSLQRLVAYGEQTGTGLWGGLRQAGRVSGLPRAAVAGAEELVDVLRPAGERLRRARAGELAGLVRQLFAEVRLRDAVLGADDPPHVASRRLENLDAVTRSVAQFERQVNSKGPLLAEYLRATALAGGDDSDPELEAGRVTLMTLHSAKGLEFPYVFLVGMEEDLLPHRKTMESNGDVFEERRLCYVGMTRARRQLWLSWARRRRQHGGMVERAASRFLAELPEGEGVGRQDRTAASDEQGSEVLAEAFFQRMREQLGS